MSKKLIIVESPTKAKTLSRFLGDDFLVEATMGHLKDLPKSKLGVDVENNFEPDYVIVEKRKKEIAKLRKEAKKVDEIYIATDPDREGEAIAQHAFEVLDSSQQSLGKGNKLKVNRIVFHEITEEAVKKAIDSPKTIDKQLVDAQIARRVLDRLVGYKLSPLLWKKVRRGLSAGRVQSVSVRLIVEREREIEKFKHQEYWEISCEVKSDGKEFVIDLVRINDKPVEVADGKSSKQIVSDLEKSNYKIVKIKTREIRRKPYAPFTTSTMAQAAAGNLYWSAKKTMSVAQKLYEEGLITYHRTDSTNIAKSAIDKVRAYIDKKYGKEYLPGKLRVFKTKTKSAQEAHEAIRPTGVNTKYEVRNTKYGKDANKLYYLIWKRFVSSQMAESIYDEKRIEVEAKSENQYLLKASGQTLRFDGWRAVYGGTDAKNQANEMPDVKEGDDTILIKVNSVQKFTQPSPRYNEASLIKTLEKLGIGRPSTYAPIISTIQLRQYVEKKERRFYPTPVGFAVNDFLISNFPNVFDYSFTAEMEEGLDKIAEGKSDHVMLVGNFYKPMAKKLILVEKNAARVKIETEKLGVKCPDCKNGELVIRIGRFGKFISCSEFPECKHTEKYLEKIGMKCPDCAKGDVIIKNTKRKRKFFGCSRYPECEFASWKKPGVKKEPEEKASKKNSPPETT